MKDQEKKRTIRTDVKIHKRTPQRPASRPSDIYISSKSKTNVVVKRVRQLMVNEHYSSVTLHGMGATVSKAISIAQAIQSALHDQVSLKPVTGTVKLIDDVIPENMDEDLDTQTRMNSAIHITLIPKKGLAELQQRVAPITQKPSRNRK